MPATRPVRPFLAASLALAASIGSPTPTCVASTMTWIADDGLFNSSSNWNLGSVPNGDDVSRFTESDGTTRTVSLGTFSNFYTNLWTYIPSGAWIFDLNDRSLTLTDTSVVSLQIGINSYANVAVRDGGLIGQAGAVGAQANGHGTLKIEADADLILNDSLRVGETGEGFLTVYGYAQSDGIIVGLGSSSFGWVKLGSGATFDSRDTGVFGAQGGTGWLLLEPGSLAEFDGLALAMDAGSDAYLSMNDALLVVNGPLRLGYDGSGSVDFANNSLVTASSVIVQGTSDCSIDATSELTTSGSLSVYDSAVMTNLGVVEVASITDLHGNGSLQVDGMLRTGSLRGDGELLLNEGAVFELLAGDLEVWADAPLGTGALLREVSVTIGGGVIVGGDAQGATGAGSLTLEDGTFSADGDVVVMPDGALVQDGVNTLAAPAIRVAGGSFQQLGGCADIGDAPGQCGAGLFVNGTEPESAVVEVTSGGSMDMPSAQVAGAPGTAGILRVSDGGHLNVDSDIILGRNDGAGVARLELSSAGEVSAPGGVTILPNSELEMSDASQVNASILNLSVLRGDGVIVGDVLNFGEIAPSQSPTSSALGITGVLTMKPGSVYACELGGISPAQRDAIDAIGGATLEGGTVQMSLINGFQPQVGQLFLILQGQITGAFDGIEPADQFALVHAADGVFVQVLSSGCSADLDGSQHVGFDDLAALLGTWGVCAGECAADLDGSGHVGFDDLAMLLGAWGACD